MKTPYLIFVFVLFLSIGKSQSSDPEYEKFNSKISHSIGFDFDISNLNSIGMNYRFQKNNHNYIFGYQMLNFGTYENEYYYKINDSILSKESIGFENRIHNLSFGYMYKLPLKPHFHFYFGAYGLLGLQQTNYNVMQQFYKNELAFNQYHDMDSSIYNRGKSNYSPTFGFYSNAGFEFLVNTFLSLNTDLSYRIFYDINMLGSGINKMSYLMHFNVGVRFYIIHKD